MSSKSKIEWTESTSNPVTGCTHISPGGDHCYADRRVSRGLPALHGLTPDGDPVPFGRVREHPERLDVPLHWRSPRMVFVCSMGDLKQADAEDEVGLLVKMPAIDGCVWDQLPDVEAT